MDKCQARNTELSALVVDTWNYLNVHNDFGAIYETLSMHGITPDMNLGHEKELKK